MRVKPPLSLQHPSGRSLVAALPFVAYFLLLCAFLYAAVKHQSWGLPESWPSDEIVWIIDRMLVTDTTNPRYFMYPSLAVYAAYIPSRIAMSVWGDMDDMTRRYVIGIICRSMSAFAFIGTCITIERLCAKAFNLRVALFALITVGLNGGLIHHAHIGTVNSLFFLTIALAVYFLVRVQKTRSIGDLYLAAAACGFAVGAKVQRAFLMCRSSVGLRADMGRAEAGSVCRAHDSCGRGQCCRVCDHDALRVARFAWLLARHVVVVERGGAALQDSAAFLGLSAEGVDGLSGILLATGALSAGGDRPRRLCNVHCGSYGRFAQGAKVGISGGAGGLPD